jgi:hypothetical protein
MDWINLAQDRDRCEHGPFCPFFLIFLSAQLRVCDLQGMKSKLLTVLSNKRHHIPGTLVPVCWYRLRSLFHRSTSEVHRCLCVTRAGRNCLCGRVRKLTWRHNTACSPAANITNNSFLAIQGKFVPVLH